MMRDGHGANAAVVKSIDAALGRLRRGHYDNVWRRWVPRGLDDRGSLGHTWRSSATDLDGKDGARHQG